MSGFVAAGLFILALSTVRGENCTFQQEGTVSLIGVRNAMNAGIVRVCRGGVWGTICNDPEKPWSLKNAQVACKSTSRRFSGALNSILQSTLTFKQRLPTSGDPIHYSRVVCVGTESSIAECELNTDTSNCTHTSDAAITCRHTSEASPSPGDVRLLGDAEDTVGAVEYFDLQLGWTGVCADPSHLSSWTYNTATARLVCRQLGYEGGRPYAQRLDALTVRNAGNLECDLDEDFTLSSCSKSVVTCDSTAPVGWVQCDKTGAGDYSIRLVGGSREGVVEVAFNGRWGTICNLSWDSTDARVACSQLGKKTEGSQSVTPSGSYVEYVSAVRPFWLTDINCVGSDDSIMDCGYDDYPIGYTICTAASLTYNAAQINCGPSILSRLSGGAIAGIVLASLAAAAVGVLLIIYGPEKWKKRHTYPWYRKLTTPREWPSVICPSSLRRRGAQCLSNIRRHSRRRCTPSSRQQANTSTAADSQSPAQTQQQRSSAPPSSTAASQSQPSAAAPQNHPPFPEPDTEPNTDLTSTAPPPYQAAVSYPAAIPQPPPPTYQEKANPYPDPSDAYPPPLSTQLGGPNYQGYPPPTVPVVGPHNTAYPPPPS